MDIFYSAHGIINGKGLNEDEKADISSRQGVQLPFGRSSGNESGDYEKVRNDGKTIDEIMIRGNVIEGYFKDKNSTEKSMKGGWFHSGG